jgi:hypothetical protein
MQRVYQLIENGESLLRGDNVSFQQGTPNDRMIRPLAFGWPSRTPIAIAIDRRSQLRKTKDPSLTQLDPRAERG